MWTFIFILCWSFLHCCKNVALAVDGREQQPLPTNYDTTLNKINWRLQTDQITAPLNTEKPRENRLYKVLQLNRSKPLLPLNPTNLGSINPNHHFSSNSGTGSLDPLTLTSLIAASQRHIQSTNNTPNIRRHGNEGSLFNPTEYDPTFSINSYLENTLRQNIGNIQKRPISTSWQSPHYSASALYQHFQPHLNPNRQYNPLYISPAINDNDGIIHSSLFQNVEPLDQTVEGQDIIRK